jgi:hypothetical protein
MGRNVWVSGKCVFYIVGWASPHFEEFSGLKINKAIPLIQDKLHKMYDKIFDEITHGNPIPSPPYGEISSLRLRNGNWWFGMQEDGVTPFSDDMKVIVVYHTLLRFMIVMSQQNQSKRIAIEDMDLQSDSGSDSGSDTEILSYSETGVEYEDDVEDDEDLSEESNENLSEDRDGDYGNNYANSDEE